MATAVAGESLLDKFGDLIADAQDSAAAGDDSAAWATFKIALASIDRLSDAECAELYAFVIGWLDGAIEFGAAHLKPLYGKAAAPGITNNPARQRQALRLALRTLAKAD